MDGERLSAEAAMRAAEFRAALRRFLRRSERIARSSGLTPQRYLLLLMIKGAPDGSEQSTVTELAERLQLAQSTVTELVRRAEEVGLVERETSAVDGPVAPPRPPGGRAEAPRPRLREHGPPVGAHVELPLRAGSRLGVEPLGSELGRETRGPFVVA